MKRLNLIASAILFITVVCTLVYTGYRHSRMDVNDPVIEVASPMVEISVKDDWSVILEGVTATDKEDGDLTDKLLVESLSNFVEKGRRVATIAVSDRANNVTKVTREVVYTDYSSPVFELRGPLSFPIGANSITKDMRVTDVLDGDLTDRVRFESRDEIYSSLLGEYAVIFTVVNSAGDVVSLPVTLELYDSNNRSYKTPQMELSEYLKYIKVGEHLNPKQFLKSIKVDGMEYRRNVYGQYEAVTERELPEEEMYFDINNVLITNDVNESVPGVYEILYKVYGSEEDEGRVRLIVIVSE